MGRKLSWEESWRAGLSCAAIVTMLTMLAVPATAFGAFSISAFSAEPYSADAGSHPDSKVSMSFGGSASDDVKDIIQHFPAGIIPNPEALPKCTQAQLADDLCPAASKLGTTTLTATPEIPPGMPSTSSGDVYNIEVDPPYVGGLGFVVRPAPGVHSSLAAPFTVRTARHPITTSLPDEKSDIYTQPIIPTARDYGLTGVSVDVPRELDLLGLGAAPIKVNSIEYTLKGIAQSTGEPYLTTTTACVQGYPMLEATSWDDPETRVARLGPVLTSTDCADDHVPFDPEPFDLSLETTRTDTPSGYDISINVPADEQPRHQSYVRRSEVALPEGTALSPPAGEGLAACGDDEVGLGTNAPPACPAGSDIGDVTVESKNVPAPLHGDLYLGRPTPQHTFRLFIAFPIVAGDWVKLESVSEPDAQTGQVTTVFDELPMLPFERFTLSLRGGDRAVLVNPATCGTHTLISTLTPWSGATDFPADKDKHPEGAFATSFDGSGAPCPSARPFDPSGTVSTSPAQAGASTAMSMTISDPDRDQLLRTLRASLPPGLVGRLAGMPLCPVGAAAAGTCGEESRIGAVTTGIGSGGSPLSMPGSIYLAKPLQAGDPASLSVVVPARVGPFDFGTVVTRARIVVRRDAGIDVAVADDFPRIVGGIPVRVRTVATTVDRPNFMLNPTSCAQLPFTSTFASFENGGAGSTSPFRVSGCEALPFSPKLRFAVEGATRANGHPALKATLTQRPGQANIARSRVALPDTIRPELLALQKPGALCPEALLATRACPPTSRVGTARAVTPILPEPLSGPVYVVQQVANPLPKLAVFLEGLVSIELDAQNTIEKLHIVNTFEAVPDVPVTSFELKIDGGKNGVLKNFSSLCEKVLHGEATFTAHSGKKFSAKPGVDVPACESASAAPRVSIKLRGVRDGSPVLTVRARRASGGARIRRLKLSLPRALHAVPRARRKGVLVKSSNRHGRRQWKLTTHSVTVKNLPARGVTQIRLVLKNGALEAGRALRRRAAAGQAPKLKFKLRIADTAKHRFTVVRKIRPAA
jgi:hypothetical protein